MSKSQAFGSWKSLLSADKLANKGIRYGHMCVDGDAVYWLESRAAEQGRGVIVKSDSAGNISEPLAKNISVRSKVHEYGSGDFFVDDGVIYFSNGNDQCIMRYDESLTENKLCRLTKQDLAAESRYADYEISFDKKYLICVREKHFENEVVNELVCISLEQPEKGGAEVRVLHSGFDFYSFPRLSPKGDRLCWNCWNQPDMPWDAAELWVADFHPNGSLDAVHKIAGGLGCNGEIDEKCSIYQPAWSDDGVLHYISDASGWTNLYSCKNGILNALTPIDREFGIPQWSLASSTYTITSCGQIYAVYIENGQQQLCRIDEDSGHIEPIALPFKDFGEHLISSENCLYFKAAGPAVSEAIYSYNFRSETISQLSKKTEFPLSVGELSVAKPIKFKSTNERACYAFYYEPHNSNYHGIVGSKPPLIVMSHGGPTGMTTSSLNAAIQFWTHRGFAVVDVNYGGSTGYGKKYRESLLGQWGVVDVEDCINAANYLVAEGLADENALLIRGGSAGGYTTLCALTFYDKFVAGVSRYGIADLECLATDSHKFEGRYLDTVVGPYPEMREIYKARSPINFTEKLSCPILILQGADDKVVPPNQAEMMVSALKQKHIPYAYRLYPGEGHGFRKAETIIDSLNAELSFYRQVLQIESDEDINKLVIEYLDK